MSLVLVHPPSQNDEGFVHIDGMEMYRIAHFDEIRPFLMSITSDTNLWMYLSTTGGLTAGRVNEDSSLFPYETEDRLHRLRGITGPITLLKVQYEARPAVLWEPFDSSRVESTVDRNIYKSPLSNHVMFEEVHHTLGLTFRYNWSGCDAHGFVRTARLINHGNRNVQVQLLDGLLNILPAGVTLGLTQSTSSLTDAYKRSEVDPTAGLAIYSLTAMVSDRPEPAECLRATVVWSRGLEKASICLDENVVRDFRSDRDFHVPPLLTGQRGAFLLQSTLTLGAGESVDWDIVADVTLDHLRLEHLRNWLSTASNPRREVQQHLTESAERLKKIVATCDGLQTSADRVATAHHAANVLFNTMRGGLPINQYRVCVDDFIRFVKERNISIYLANETAINRWDAALTVDELIAQAERTGVVDLVRLAFEYLPLTFGRRHGDPSRPWNRFAIHLKNPDGSRRIGYQGNWRDIFQNWEALAMSFPNMLESFIAKFVNASTVDGFNPYRLSHEGIDWEVHDPEDPWSNIGYWGDHQIIYLLKLLEASSQFHPGLVQRLMVRPIFSYANVPYRLRPYSLITKDPRNTLEYDHQLGKEIETRVRSLGADGKLLLDSDGKVYHVTLLEKLMVPMLSKLSNLVIGGGIWMNTQRPEWNDANNALAGNGVSVVTLCYLRRYVNHLLATLSPISAQSTRMSAEVLEWAEQLHASIRNHFHLPHEPPFSSAQRRDALDEFGATFDSYRQKVYANGFTGKVAVTIRSLLPVLEAALRLIDDSIEQNRRQDHLYCAYNLLNLTNPQSAHLSPLHEMLEGQVAALSSGKLSATSAVELLESLFSSALWREDQQSFMLYPKRDLPDFLDRNVIADKHILSNPLVVELLRSGDQTILAKDVKGNLRFNGDFHHARDLEVALTRLGRHSRWQTLVVSHRKAVLDAFESVFHHHAFTGRSSTMFAFEGIGCVYWHMVAKLLLATQEIFWQAIDSGTGETARLAEIYYRIRRGLGFNKHAAEYGAVPLDPYSHTPANGGARQPGMTGQVKEEILMRLGEWGVRIRNGQVHFDPRLLRTREFLAAASTFEHVDLQGESQRVELPELSSAFTLCQTPVIYTLNGSETLLELHYVDGRVEKSVALTLSRDDSARIFARTGEIREIRVTLPSTLLLQERPYISSMPTPADACGDTLSASCRLVRGTLC